MRFRKEIKLAFSYVKEYKSLVCLNSFVLILTSLFEGIGIGMIVPILQTMTGTDTANVFTKYAQSACGLLGIEYSFLNLMVIFGIIILMKYAFLAWQQNIARVLSASVTHELREKAFQNLMDIPLEFYYKTKSGDIIATVYTSSINAGGLIENAIRMFTALLFCFVYMAFSLLISIPLTIIAYSAALLSYKLVVPRFKIAFTRGEEQKTITDKISSFLFDKLSGIKIIKSFNNERFHIKEFRQLISAFKKLQIKIQNNRIIAGLLMEPAVFILVIALMIFSIEILHMSVVLLITFLYIFRSLIPKINSINKEYLTVSELLPHFNKVQNIIERKDKRYLRDGTKSLRAVESEIVFNNVWFRYPQAHTHALKGINIAIEKNRTTALIGASGGGKTTLVDLILRLHDPEKGSIKIDGVDLREIKRSDWHNLVSVVDQNLYLFNDTVYNNILYGSLDAARDDVINAAGMANAHDFISMLPDKYDSLVGERGIKLSGGQKQRIALARALIRDPEILILDEATSALDSESERLIQSSIEKLSKGKTIIIIAHRLSTITHADKIIVVENGEIAEQGVPEELLQKDGMYKRYYSLQLEHSRRKE